MARKKVLIITHTRDNDCVSNVIDHINALGGDAIRFNVDRYPTAIDLTSCYANGKWQIILKDEESHSLTDIASVWYRRSHHIGGNVKELLAEAYYAAATGEIKRTLYGMVEALPCFQMERYSTYRRLDSKEEQLKVAASCGLQIPATCISNSPEEVKNFINNNGEVITKMQSSFSIRQEGIEQVVFTNQVSEADLDQLDTLQYCPMMFQQKLEKQLELRVTIVGNQCFAFSVNSQQTIDAQIDWRRDGLKLINAWQPYPLPPEIERRLSALMDYYKLNYGAVDLILTPDNQYYFLEINPAGEYFWLDKLCEHAISKQIAAVLLGHTFRRNVSPIPNNRRCKAMNQNDQSSHLPVLHKGGNR
ncbi:hypothetical protein GCM10023231_24050 [Olivibacter ginsenosidimutans]|uniref:MvdD family ATP-grasp ribosomal peptide maturase n=1 Tax=Olivibacter ginsenosidimutans TaxID=1176537 RepID=A0ABP9BFG0_9SPHI